MLTLSLVYWPYFWSVDHISGLLTIFLVCWPYFWHVDLKSGIVSGFSFKGFNCQVVLYWVRHAKCTWSSLYCHANWQFTSYMTLCKNVILQAWSAWTGLAHRFHSCRESRIRQPFYHRWLFFISQVYWHCSCSEWATQGSQLNTGRPVGIQT